MSCVSVLRLDMICDFTPLRQRGYVFSSGRSHLNDKRSSRCATGFEGTPSNITCTVNGTWSPATGCSSISADCESGLVTTRLSSSSMNNCGGSCSSTSEGTSCQCSEGFQSSIDLVCEQV